MSTIERALEKQRKLAEERRKASEQRLEDALRVGQKTDAPDPEPPEKQDSTEDAAVEVATEVPAAAPVRDQNSGHAQADTRESLLQIDIERLEMLGYITPTETFSRIKEEYRYIKRPLLNNAFGSGADLLHHPNLIMVTSSYSGEGKTFTAINLAISMALEQDRFVLLIDADVIHPHVCERLGVPEPKRGLMDYLLGRAEMEEIICNTSIPKLKLISAGRRHHHASEMLASEKMTRLMRELSTRYPDRVVIFDTSPLLGASETHVLSQQAGQAVVVVEEGRTTHQQLQQALKLLNPDMAINLVLNKSRAGRGEYYGYYYANS